jgi:hypothetical protein
MVFQELIDCEEEASYAGLEKGTRRALTLCGRGGREENGKGGRRGEELSARGLR